MGGEGTWSLAAAHPSRWAVIVPLCPSENPSAVTKLKHIPCWCFQGDADGVDTLNATRRMVQAIDPLAVESPTSNTPASATETRCHALVD